MTIPTSGELKASDVNVEIGKEPTDRFSINSAGSRELANKKTLGSRIAFSDYRGHKFRTGLVIDKSQNSTYDLRANALAQGWDGSSRIEAVVKSGVTLIGDPALMIGGDFPNGVYLTVEAGASILGRGGKGGNGSSQSHFALLIAAEAGGAGGAAIRLGNSTGQTQFTCYIYNYGLVCGGGGGGGGGGGAHAKHNKGWGGGGGGGGVPYGGLGLAGIDTGYGMSSANGTAATATAIGKGGGYGGFSGGGNGGYAGGYGESGREGMVGEWMSVGTPGVGGAAGAYISGGRYARIESGIGGTNFMGSYVY